jgi:copper chaperone CopZ
MASVTINLPTMFADHHVLTVRGVLSALQGVGDVYASSAWHAVIVTYDTDKLDPHSIEKALVDAGYTPDASTPILADPGGAQFKDPAWDVLGARVTQTNEADRKMSGEFRRY